MVRISTSKPKCLIGTEGSGGEARVNPGGGLLFKMNRLYLSKVGLAHLPQNLTPFMIENFSISKVKTHFEMEGELSNITSGLKMLKNESALENIKIKLIFDDVEAPIGEAPITVAEQEIWNKGDIKPLNLDFKIESEIKKFDISEYSSYYRLIVEFKSQEKEDNFSIETNIFEINI